MENFRRTLWMLAGVPMLRLTFHNWYGLRAAVLRLFGARIGRATRVSRSVRIFAPWRLDLGNGVAVGDGAILYSVGCIRIEHAAVISQYAHLCAGTHDYRDPAFPVVRGDISVGTGAWVATDAFVGPGVRIGARAILGARACAFKDLDADFVYVGNPARRSHLRQGEV